MKFTQFKNIILFTFFLLVVRSCSDEFSLFSDELKLGNKFEETVVLYANFNTGDKIHLIRVNRGFAPINFFEAQGIQDSIQYLPGELKVFFHKIYKGDTVETYECYDTIVKKDQGEFFNTGKVLMYAFRTPNMFGYSVEDLKYMVEVRTPKNDTIWAVTKPIKNFRTSIPRPTVAEVGFDRLVFNVEFGVPKNSIIFEVKLLLDYSEMRTNESTPIQFQVPILMGREVDEEVSLKKSFKISSKEIYKQLSAFIQKNGDLENTIQRKFSAIHIEILCGNGDLAMASSSFATSSGFSDNLTSYSNVINGLGFVSAHYKFKHKYKLNRTSIDSVRNRFPEYRFVKNN